MDPPNYRAAELNDCGAGRHCDGCLYLRSMRRVNVCMKYLKLNVELFHVCDGWDDGSFLLRDSRVDKEELEMIMGLRPHPPPEEWRAGEMELHVKRRIRLVGPDFTPNK